MAISKIVMRAIVPLKPSSTAMAKTATGASISLYSKATLMCFNSLNQPPNLSCKPIENKASGPTVPASFSKSGSSGLIRIKCGTVNAKMQPISGGKVSTFLSTSCALSFWFCDERMATTIPMVDKSIKVA
ncbi:hypothetical protein D3C85_1209080 [compost metagenome]